MKEFFPVIRSSQLFSGVSEEELTAMLSCLAPRKESFPKDALLLRIGDTADVHRSCAVGQRSNHTGGHLGQPQHHFQGRGAGRPLPPPMPARPGSVLNVSVVAETAVTVHVSERKARAACVLLPPARTIAVSSEICSASLPKRTCASAKSLRIWDSAQRAQSSCPIFPQRHSGSENMNSIFPFPDSSLRITSRWSAADFRWSLGKCERRVCWIFIKTISF